MPLTTAAPLFPRRLVDWDKEEKTLHMKKSSREPLYSDGSTDSAVCVLIVKLFVPPPPENTVLLKVQCATAEPSISSILFLAFSHILNRPMQVPTYLVCPTHCVQMMICY